ncbi:Golgin candidate 4 [Rhynchospora pubera]|uniref:Golgin candidate 4 n=1 Tax=Rhynchospora pubera TaxID=906938 RepID=A0AAV8C0X5_9POAL|nr:Golgin candidate 4 [Rhynchospora pubera]
MRSSIATYRESLSRIASELSDEEDQEHTPPSSSRRRRITSTTPSSVGSGSGSGSPLPLPNGSESEIATYNYNAHIQKLQASEAQLKALSFNYAAMLKDKDHQLSLLRQQIANFDANAKLQGQTPPPNSRLTAINSSKQTPSRTNGTLPTNALSKEYSNILEENNRLQLQIQHLTEQLKHQHEKATITLNNFQDESKRNASFQTELHGLQVEKEKMSANMRELQVELNEKNIELRRLQEEIITIGKTDQLEESPHALKNIITALHKEIALLKLEKENFEAKLACTTSEKSNQNAIGAAGMGFLLEKVVEEMKSSIALLEKKLEAATKERDKALQELGRLKQHLLDKENEDSIIEELEATVENQKAHIVQLERSLRNINININI